MAIDFPKEAFKRFENWLDKQSIPEPCQECHYWVKTKCVAYDCKHKNEGVKDENRTDNK